MQITNVLVISYYFPPFKRVGGRRWAKHAKYMNRSGINTYVLAADFPGSVSVWDQDVVEYSDKVTRIAGALPKEPFFKKKLPVGIGEKFRWKLSHYKHSTRNYFHKGNSNDISLGAQNAFLKAALQIINEKQIQLLILSVGPFRYSSIIPALREKHPDLKIVIDYRDKREDSFKGLSPARVAFETRQQAKVLAAADLVLTVNDNISEHIKTLLPGKDVFTLPHCVDEDFYRMSLLPAHARDADGEDRFIYGGELYNGMEHELKTFVTFFEGYRQRSGARASFHLSYPAYEQILRGEGIRCADFLSKEKFIEELQKSSYILLFRPSWSSEAFSSKFFEILCLRKPVLYFGNKGKVSEFIEEHKLGYHIRPEKIEEDLSMILENKSTGHIPDMGFDLSQYTFETYTFRLMEKLGLLNNKA